MIAKVLLGCGSVLDLEAAPGALVDLLRSDAEIECGTCGPEPVVGVVA